MKPLIGFCVVAGAALLADRAEAQEEYVRCDPTAVDWSLCVEDEPKECWVVSAPKETVNTRGGRQVQVRRGDILLFVTNRPAAGVESEVSFTGGYPFAEDSTVNLEIGATTFELFTEGEWAWPASRSADTEIVAAMRRGAQAVLTGRSARGTTTRDTFSLFGFTATLEEAEKRCAS